MWFKIAKSKQTLEPEDAISYQIIGAAIEVHRQLGGPGLLENVYEEALVWELEERGLQAERQLAIPIQYKGRQLASPLRVDLLVEQCVIVKNKSVVAYNTIFEAQTLTYLRLLKLRLGLVINFGETFVKDGVHRVINTSR